MGWTYGVIDVQARGGDGALWSRVSTGNGGTTWTNWYSFGGQLLAGTGPSEDARESPYVVGTDHALWWQILLGGVSGWASLGGYLTSSPAAVDTANGNTINVFARGGDNFLWERVSTNGGPLWGNWFSIGGI